MPSRPRFVVDTNVMVSRLFFRKSAPAHALRHAAIRMQLLISPDTMDELEEVLSRSKFEKYLPANVRVQFLRQLRRTAVQVSEAAEVRACRDPKDDKFLSLAVAGGARLILSGDQDLLALHPFGGIQILSPRQYLELARKEGA